MHLRDLGLLTGPFFHARLIYCNNSNGRIKKMSTKKLKCTEPLMLDFK